MKKGFAFYSAHFGTASHFYSELVSFLSFKDERKDFPGGTVVKNPPANAGDTGSSPGPGRSHMPRSN